MSVCSLLSFACILLCAIPASPRPMPLPRVSQDCRPGDVVTTQGLVVDVFPDETDRNYYHVFLYDRGDILALAIDQENHDCRNLTNLINSCVSATGTVSPPIQGLRKHRRRYLTKVSSIRRLGSQADGKYEPVVLSKTELLDMNSIKALGWCSVTGRVLAAWQGSSLLVEADNGDLVRALLARASCPPRVDSRIRLVGIADTDSINLVFKCASWTEVAERPPEDPPKPLELAPEDTADYFLKGSGINDKLVRLRGTVAHVPREEYQGRFLILECDGFPVKIDPGNVPDAFSLLKPGAFAEITGIIVYVLDADTLSLPFARAREKVVIIRSNSDVRLIREPSWWTPGRLTSVIALLLGLLAAILIWNKSLQRAVLRRGQQLVKEELAHIESDLKIDERTRLAVELHDSLSQTLTGAAMEVRTASMLRGNAPAEMIRHLDVAAQTLQACRTELRNCLWDLRSQTLDVPDMTTAVLRTLEPHLNGQKLTVRFNVPRNRLSDNIAHLILRVTRELVLNAITHGQARAIRIAGTQDGDKLRFSVSDDGCGFDVAHSPGVAQGHFGLQGINERIRSYGGRMTVNSAPGSGAHISIIITNQSEKTT